MFDATTSGLPLVQSDAELLEAAFEALLEAGPAEFLNNNPLGGNLLKDNETLADAGKLVRKLISRTPTLLEHSFTLFSEFGRIGLGRSEILPEKDKRFADDAFVKNPFFRRLAQNYLAWNTAVHELIDEIDVDPKENLRSHFLASLLTEAVAPTNTLAGNPAAIREAVKTRGKSLANGARQLAHDVRHNGGMPSMVDTTPFKVGENVAATPGAVVLRTEVIELIRYQPTTAKVYERPLLVVPPEVNKYYVLDLAPGRSMVEAAVAAGHQVFMISWRNPTAEQRDWNLDTYCSAILDAIDVTLELSKQEDLNLMGVCAGGITSAAALGYMAATGDQRVNSVTFPVTVLDWDAPSTMGTFTSGPAVAQAAKASQEKGILEGAELNRIFAWLRPNDLVWNYVVNNYLMGKTPPAFDILSWNVDAANLPAGLHADFLNIASTNGLTKPGEIKVLEEKVDLSTVTCDAYVVGGLTDHITPWEGCYRTIDLLGGASEFVLVGSGHIQTLVCPLDNPKARYYTNPEHAHDAEAWKDAATEHNGSWWTHWLAWLTPRAGRLVAAPKRLGNRQHPSLEAAPGQYVHVKA